jgi:AraC family transcriptional regulator, arabinose operon regulatory protein
MIISSGLISHDPTTVFHREPGFPLWTAGMLLRGSAVYSVAGRAVSVFSPSFLFVAPGVEYTLSGGSSLKPWIEAWVVFEPRVSWMGLLRLTEVLPGLSSVSAPDDGPGRRIVAAAAEGVRRAARAPRWRAEIAENTLERLLLDLQLMAGRTDAVNDLWLDPRVVRVADALRRDYRRPWSVTEMASLAHLSASHFAHLFARNLGESPRSFLETVRMERAKELLLSTNSSIQLVSRDVGFRDPVHFSGRFMSRHGVSPSHFRRHPEP